MNTRTASFLPRLVQTLILLLAGALLARAADSPTVIYSTLRLNGAAFSNVVVQVTPIQLSTLSNSIVAPFSYSNVTRYDGTLTITNIVPQSYRVTMRYQTGIATFTNCFTGLTGTIYASDYICGATPTNGLIAYSTAQADALFALRTNAIRMQTNGVSVAAGYTNLNWAAGVTGYLSGATLVLGVNASGGGGDAGGTNARQFGSLILTNLSGTGALTNAADYQPASATLTNLDSNPVKDYTNRLIAGSSITLTTNAGGIVTVASTASGGGGITTNANQFAANDTLNIKDGALLTNIIFTAGIDTGASRSNWVFNTQSGRVLADFRCLEAGLRTVWITNTLITANSVVITSHAGTNAIASPLLPPLSHSVATGILKLHMSPVSWNTVNNIATVSWFICNPGQ